MVGPTTCLNADHAGRPVRKVRQHLSSLELLIDDLAAVHVHRVQLKHALGNVQPHHLLATDRANDLPCAHACFTIHVGPSMAFVKTVVYHALGTSMP